MADQETIRAALERNVKAVTLRPAVGRGTARTKVRAAGGLRCEAEDGSWSLVVDMSEKSGGERSGPDPGVMGRTALGSCLTINYLQWAARLGVPINALEVEVAADYDVRGNYGVDESVPPGYSQIRYTVTVASPAPAEEVRSLIERADRTCPYLDNFRRPVDVRRELIVSGEES